VESGFFARWDTLPVRYKYVVFSATAFALAMAAGISDNRWATAGWVLGTLAGAFLCIYAFPSVWRYVFYLGLIYILAAMGTLMPLFYVSAAPFFIGWAIILHVLAILVAYNLVKDVFMQRKAYHIVALTEGKQAPYVPMGRWIIALVAFIFFADLSMVGYTSWALHDGTLALYIFCELVLIALAMYILEIPERAFGGKGVDFVPRVSLSEISSETKKVAKRIVKRPKREPKAARTVAAAKATRRPRVLVDGTLECPACGHDLAIDVRRCPECYKENEFAWCPASEHYIIPCPACGKPTVYGEGKCSHCDHDLALRYKCPNCLKANPLNRWERA
jgi:predicted RNA-binding Zn-ribbon protein involved in translation (DUF1610 family)